VTVALLLAYAFGIGVPFMLAALGLASFQALAERLRRAVPIVERVAAACSSCVDCCSPPTRSPTSPRISPNSPPRWGPLSVRRPGPPRHRHPVKRGPTTIGAGGGAAGVDAGAKEKR
jgi:hypothetical protein